MNVRMFCDTFLRRVIPSIVPDGDAVAESDIQFGEAPGTTRLTASETSRGLAKSDRGDVPSILLLSALSTEPEKNRPSQSCQEIVLRSGPITTRLARLLADP